MKEIRLTRGQVSIVDDEDYERLMLHSWQALWNKNIRAFYATTTITKPARKCVLMHRMVLGIDDPFIKVDHRNHDTLDNRRGNLRVSTSSQSAMNRRKRVDAASRFKGLMLDRKSKSKPWRARITVQGEIISLGSYAREISAAKAYNDAARLYFGEFAVLNEIDQMDTSSGITPLPDGADVDIR